MTFKHSITILLLCSSVMLAACATKHKSDDSAISDANSAYQNDDAQSSGMGGSSGGYGDDSDPMHRVYYFDYDSNVVRDNDRQAIIANADKLSAHASTKALVEGYTDPRGSREYNIGLGERRAQAVVQILTSHGVSRSQVRVVSYGSQKPAVSGQTEEAYQQDRRAVLEY